MSSYDPSQWYSYSKNRPNEVPSKIVVADTETNVADSSNIDRKQSDENIALASDTSQQQEQSGLEEMPKREEVKLDSITPLQSSNSKVNNFIKRLQKMVRELPSCYKRKVTYDVICQLAESLIDDTVFEIAKGLEDIQQLSETNLLNKRMKILSDQKGQRMEMTKRHQTELEDCGSKAHQIKLLEREQGEEKKVLNEKLERELMQLDQTILLEIDQLVIDQQATLQRAGVPLFFITNKQEEVQLQMYLLDFITRLIPEKT